MRNPYIAGYGLVAGAALLLVGGPLHPHGPRDSLESHLIEMLESPMWVPSHTIAMIGMGLLAASLFSVARSGLVSSRTAPFVVVAAVGALLATIEFIPHILAVTELDALRAGAAAPLTRTHEVIAALSGPLFGFGSVLLAIVVAAGAARRRALWWVAAVPAVAGGVAFAMAVPLVLVTRDANWTLLFPGIAAVAAWYLVYGIVWTRRALPAARAAMASATEPDEPTPVPTA